MKILLVVSTLVLSGCASMNFKENNPDTIIDDIIVIGTMGLIR